MQSHIRKIVDDQEITDPNIILNKITNFYESLFKKMTEGVPPKLLIFLIKFSFQNSILLKLMSCLKNNCISP